MPTLPVWFGGTVVAQTIVDEEDAHLGAYDWRLGTGGDVVRGTMESGEYRVVRIHRVIAGLRHGDGLQVDHINRNRLDNRRSNLRVVTTQQNSQNVPARGGSSRYRGVSWKKRERRWVAAASIGNKRYHLGGFETEEAAHAAVVAWRREHMPYSVEAGGER